jgi:hypothetical protein
MEKENRERCGTAKAFDPRDLRHDTPIHRPAIIGARIKARRLPETV